MNIFRLLSRVFFVNRMLRGRRNRGYGRSFGYGGRRSRGRAGFFGPMPYYSRQTRGGSRVSVSGCCLPIPFALAIGSAATARSLLRR